MTFNVEIEQELDGRWNSEVVGVSGAFAYGATRDEAIRRIQALTLRVTADRLEHGEEPAWLVDFVFEQA